MIEMVDAKILRQTRRRKLAPLAALATLIVTAACDPQYVPPPHLSPQQAHPYTLERDTVSLSIDLPGSVAELEDGERARLSEFIKHFEDDGRGMLSITVGGDPGKREHALTPARMLRSFAVERGLQPSAVRVQFVTASSAPYGLAVLSYDRLAVRLPACNQWHSDLGTLNYSNAAHPNYGCATQRYVGAMVADPADLFRARAASPFDPARSDRVISQYRQGESTVRAVSGREVTFEGSSTSGATGN